MKKTRLKVAPIILHLYLNKGCPPRILTSYANGMLLKILEKALIFGFFPLKVVVS